VPTNPETGSELAVKGIDGRFAEAVKGYRGYSAGQLRRV